MSITLLIEQNVYRYYALTDHTPSHYCLQDIECVFRFMCHLFLNGLSPAFVFTSVISHLFEPQRLEMVMVDTTDQAISPPSLRYTAAQSNRLNTSIRCWFSSVNIQLIKSVVKLNTDTNISPQMHSRALGRGDTDASLTPPQSATYYLYSPHIHS